MKGYILTLLLTISEPFVYVKKKLEVNKVTGYLGVQLMWDQCTSLMGLIDGHREPAPNDEQCYWRVSRPPLNTSTLAGVTALAPSYIRKIREVSHKRCRPQRVMATVLDPQWKMIIGVPDIEHDRVWRAVSESAADIALSRNHHR